jgi:hypothetical protein
LRESFWAGRDFTTLEQCNRQALLWRDQVAHQRPWPGDDTRTVALATNSVGGTMTKSVEGAAQRRKLLGEIEPLAEIAVFGTLSETYRTCGRAGCHCQGDGPKHGPHLNVSYRGEQGKTTGYYVPKGAEGSTRQGVAAWQQMQQRLRELAELNKERNLQSAREVDSR